MKLNNHMDDIWNIQNGASSQFFHYFSSIKNIFLDTVKKIYWFDYWKLTLIITRWLGGISYNFIDS